MSMVPRVHIHVCLCAVLGEPSRLSLQRQLSQRWSCPKHRPLTRARHSCTTLLSCECTALLSCECTALLSCECVTVLSCVCAHTHVLLIVYCVCYYMYTCIYMLLCLVVCLTLLASFFLPSHLSLKHVYIYMYIHTGSLSTV